MVAWWPFDSFVDGGLPCPPVYDGLAFTPDIVRGKEDRVFGDTLGSDGCKPAPPGFLGGAMNFDGSNDYVEAANQASLNFGAGTSGTDNGNFSIDAWIYRPSFDTSIEKLVDKRREQSGPTVVGYSLFLQDDTLWIQLADGVGSEFSNYDSGLQVTPGQWHQVAVTIDRDQSNGGTFYIDGRPAGYPGPTVHFDPTLRQGSLSNTFPLRIGKRSDSSTSGFFTGWIDELEIFRRKLNDAEILTLYQTGLSGVGKCKPARCHLPPTTGMSKSQKSAVVSVTICNNSGSPDTFRWSLAPVVGTGASPCEANGPSIFQPPTGKVTIAAGECTSIPVTIGRPSGFSGSAITACFDVTAVPDSGSECFSCRASQFNSFLWMILNPGLFNTPLLVPFGQAANASFKVQNLGDSSGAFVYSLDVMSTTPGGVNTNVSLNGLPPGTKVSGSIALSPQEVGTISVNASFLQHEAFALYNLVLYGDTDNDGVPDSPITSIGLRSVLGDSAATPCDTSLPSDAITLAWTSQERFAWNSLRPCDGVFNVYRQTSRKLIDLDNDKLADDYGTCFLTNLTVSEAFDETDPAVGWAHFYLVSGRNAAGEGSLGTNSLGVAIPNRSPCP